jgi:hypothetical protein
MFDERLRRRCAEAVCDWDHPNWSPRLPPLPYSFDGESRMSWLIGRAAAMSDPEGARRKALEKLRGIAEMEDPESLVVPILIDAILLVESYRGARHQITFLDDLTGSVDTLLRELTIVEKSRLWAAE